MKRTCLLYLFILLFLPCFGSSDSTALSRLFGYVRNVEVFNRTFPQEKVYLHLDNTGYFMGETLWFKAYVVRSDSVFGTDLSRVLYVELVGPFGEVLETCKLPVRGGQASGSFSLKKLLSDGFYEIRAYTRYMINWDASGVFSRVFPVFQRPDKAGDYSVRKISREYLDYRQGEVLPPDSLRGKERRRFLSDPVPELTFYPEGGHLVRGLPCRVAFEYALPDTTAPAFSGYLLDSRGDTLCPVSSEREGRGVFSCVPDTGRLSLVFEHGGRRYRRALPRAEDTGFVLGVNATGAGRVHASVSGSPSLSGRLLGLALMHGGRVLAFDTLRTGSSPVLKSFDRGSLPAGVSQLTLFDSSGRIWGDRLFFVIPPASSVPSPLRCSFPDSTIAPYREEHLSITGPPCSVVSVSVRDAASRTNGYRGNVSSWLLLSSELRGFIRDADYYLECDDAAHRRAADLLMLVQGWRRYDWCVMSGASAFPKVQPLEDGLYLDGRLLPRKKRQSVGGISLKATLYNRFGEVLKGEALTDSLGYYAFRLPSCEGDWTLFFHTSREDKQESFRVTVNRHFSPARRLYSYAESDLFLPPSARRYFSSGSQGVPDTALVDASRRSDRSLGEVEVKAHRFEGKRAWEVSRRYAARRSQFYFNMDEVADRYLDRGEDCPFLFDWLMSYPAFSKDYYNGKRGIAWVYENISANPKVETDMELVGRENIGRGGTTVSVEMPRSFRPGAKISLYPERVIAYSRGKIILHTDYEDAGLNKEGSPLVTLDELKDVYVSLDHGVVRYMTDEQKGFLGRFDPIHVFIYPHYSFDYKVKGLRRTHFEGYNVPQTFRMNDYNILPKEADYRRTLYWNPDVRLDSEGKADLSFWNNSTCTDVSLSVEGFTVEGSPLYYKEQ